MMQEQCVSFEVAKLLMEKGFNCKTPYYYSPEGEFKSWGSDGYLGYIDNSGVKTWWFECVAPTQSLAMKWLRDIHKIHLDIGILHSKNSIDYPPKYYVYVDSITTGESLLEYGPFFERTGTSTIANENGPKEFDSYEEAVETAIKYCLEELLEELI